MLKAEALTLLKEEVLSMGQLVVSTVEAMAGLLNGENGARLSLIEEQEELINTRHQEIEERCLELLTDVSEPKMHQIRTLVGSTIIATKLERMADHANRVARIASWANEDGIAIPEELSEMAKVVQRMAGDALLCIVADELERAREVVLSDSRVDYLHDCLSKRLLSDLGEQAAETAQMRAQFLFCARFLERMGDLLTSIAKRVHYTVTGSRLCAD